MSHVWDKKSDKNVRFSDINKSSRDFISGQTKPLRVVTTIKFVLKSLC